jgi:glucan phosphoethanolaminetransferase (alkaline phosphatase superfamily)
MDVPVSYIYKYFWGSGVPHMITAFQALNMNWTTSALFIGALFFIPFLGIALYRATEPLSKKIPWNPSILRLILTLFWTGGSLLTLDLVIHPFVTSSSYDKFQKALPLGSTFLAPAGDLLPLPKPVGKARDETTTRKLLVEKKLVSAEKPNIYLFIIETLRKDFLTPKSAPNLLAFAKENIAPEESFSNANSTHPSWFAIFHADFPYHWTHMRETWQGGSIPLQMLKNSGYKIRVYSSADLELFNMDQLIFGKNRQLIDHIEDFSQIRFIEPCERDRRALEALTGTLDATESKRGNVFIVFLDATHSEYSVPPDFPLPFQPTIKEIDYLRIASDTVEPLKNRYRNSISYIDSLMGKFFQALTQKDLYADAIIAITGDHGEEFFEEGALFHGTHLNRYQTSVPIFFKFQKNPWIPQDTCTTHLDIFPSIIHHLTGQSNFSDLFDGQSLFAPNRWPFRIAVLQNGPKTPYEFCISRKDEHFRFRFPNALHIYDAKELEILKIETPLPDTNDLLGPLLKE